MPTLSIGLNIYFQVSQTSGTLTSRTARVPSARETHPRARPTWHLSWNATPSSRCSRESWIRPVPSWAASCRSRVICRWQWGSTSSWERCVPNCDSGQYGNAAFWTLCAVCQPWHARGAERKVKEIIGHSLRQWSEQCNKGAYVRLQSNLDITTTGITNYSSLRTEWVLVLPLKQCYKCMLITNYPT